MRKSCSFILGMHVIGFRSVFGIDDGEEVKQKRIIQEWREKRDQRRREAKEKEEQMKAGINKEEQSVELHEVELEKEREEIVKADIGNGEKHMKSHESGKIKGNTEFVVEAIVEKSGKELVEVEKGIMKKNEQMLDICTSVVVNKTKQLEKVPDKGLEKEANIKKEISSNSHLAIQVYEEESKDTTGSFQSGI